jgi:hypothetical protein
MIRNPQIALTSWKRKAIASVAAMAAVSTVVSLATTATAAPVTGIAVDFTKALAPTPASNIGFTATTFRVEGGPVARSDADIAALRNLSVGSVRLHLKPGGTGVISGAEGGDSTVSGQAWLDAYKRIGAKPTVIVNLDVDDATDVLRYLVANNYDVDRFIVGNEMDGNSKSAVSEGDYTTKFHQIAAAMRAIKPGIQVGGPGVACWDCINEQWVKRLMDAPANERPSFIDYHAYGAGRGQNATMASSLVYNEQLPKLRQWINDPSVGVQIGEFNMNWGDESQNNTQTQTVWVANALGSILANGGVAFQYGDKNNAMGLTSNNGVPKASYWGMGMFTGASTFRHFGTTMVASTTTNDAVKVYASNNAKNIVVVNSGDATNANLDLIGYGDGVAHVWQSNAVNLVDKGEISVSSGAFRADIPANSVTTFVLGDETSVPTTQAPTTTTKPVTTLPPTTTSSTTAVPASTVPPATVPPTTALTTVKPSTTTVMPVVIPPVVDSASTSGLQAEYFNNKSLSGTPAVTRVDQTVNFNWGTGSPADGVHDDNFSARWTGQIVAPKSETYTFRTSSDDGIRVWIAGQLVIDNWTDHGWTDNTKHVALTAGQSYDIKIEYYESGNTALAMLRWSSPSTPLDVVPGTSLRH